jgi:hypothetical protein
MSGSDEERENEAPFAFASSSKRFRPEEHTCGSNCFHDQVISNGTRKSCATAQLLNSLNATLPRFTGRSLTERLRQAKFTVCQLLVPPDFATGVVTGLKSALALVLGVPKSFIDYAVGARSTFTNAEMNARLEAGDDISRRARSDRYNRLVPYNYFHSKGDLPDFCLLVEPNKNKRSAWKGKVWELAGEQMILTCQPHQRRGLISTLVQDYRDSETCRV